MPPKHKEIKVDSGNDEDCVYKVTSLGVGVSATSCRCISIAPFTSQPSIFFFKKKITLAMTNCWPDERDFRVVFLHDLIPLRRYVVLVASTVASSLLELYPWM